MPELPDHYKTLGIPPTADSATIKRAYYEHIRRNHPDTLMAERRRLESQGDRAGLKKLEERLEKARRISQGLNAAYGVLSDAERRAEYDRQRARAAPPPPPTGDPDAEYDRRRAGRPHSQPAPAGRRPAPPPQNEQFPAVLAIGFILLLAVGTTLVSSVLRLPGQRVEGVAQPPTVYMPVGSTDATAQALRRTPTPRPAASYIISGDALYAARLYPDAIAEYTQALRQGLLTAEVYWKRGRAYAAADDPDRALTDLNQALRLDAALLAAYSERGLVYTALWQRDRQTDAAEAARRDFATYERLGGDMTGAILAAARARLGE
ncbi:MAG: J domain-containing protein [Anaerolineae bacterium]|jgi:hypothetical protein|nr:J domain-containing protein [Anaerolineae bacterium]